MLNMGFVDDVEKILGHGGGTDVQTLLFSATLPAWVKDITRRFLKPAHKVVDLVGNEKQKVLLMTCLHFICFVLSYRLLEGCVCTLPLGCTCWLISNDVACGTGVHATGEDWV